MPEIQLKCEATSKRRLSEVPECEVWLDETGYASWCNGNAVLSADPDSGRIFHTGEKPEFVKVVRKLSDPIIVRW